MDAISTRAYAHAHGHVLLQVERALDGEFNSGLGLGNDASKTNFLEMPLNMAVECQFIYQPFLEQGRKYSHLPYKVMRCAEPLELVRDAAKGGESKELSQAIEACSSLFCPAGRLKPCPEETGSNASERDEELSEETGSNASERDEELSA